jgi:hypothetical protein
VTRGLAKRLKFMNIDRIAGDVNRLLDEIIETIPDLDTPHPLNSKDARAARTVSRDFLVRLIHATEELPDLEDFGFLRPEEAREVLQFIDAFRPIADRLAVLLKTLNHTMAARKAKIAIAAMNTYMMAKRYARRPQNAALSLHVERLRQALGRTNRKR